MAKAAVWTKAQSLVLFIISICYKLHDQTTLLDHTCTFCALQLVINQIHFNLSYGLKSCKSIIAKKLNICNT